MWIAVAAAILVIGYLVLGSWQAANLLDSTLRVGAPTEQSSGWPTPQSPANIGYEGDPKEAYDYAFQDVELSGELGALPAWLIPAAHQNANAPWSIFVHGIGGRRENGWERAELVEIGAVVPSALHTIGLPPSARFSKTRLTRPITSSVVCIVFPIEPWDCLSAPAGGEGHQIVNSGDVPLRLAFSNNTNADVVEYLDSGKIRIDIGATRHHRENATFGAGGRLVPMGYWEGEQTD